MSNSSDAANDRETSPGHMPEVALSPAEWEIISRILGRHLPGRQIWAYGSRARRTNLKKYSDLDLAIEGPALSLAAMADLREDFDDSPLPFKVDLTEVNSLEPEFLQRIEADKVLLTTPKP